MRKLAAVVLAFLLWTAPVIGQTPSRSGYSERVVGGILIPGFGITPAADSIRSGYTEKVNGGLYIPGYGITPMLETNFGSSLHACLTGPAIKNYVSPSQGERLVLMHLTREAMQLQIAQLVVNGFRPRNVGVHVENGRALFSTIWEKGRIGSWEFRTDLTRDALQAMTDQGLSTGYNVVYQCGYVVNNNVRFSCIWEKNPNIKRFEARHSLSHDQLASRWAQMSQTNLHPVALNSYYYNNRIYYSDAWISDDLSVFYDGRIGLTDSEVQKRAALLSSQGYRLVSIWGTKAGDTVSYCDLWYR